MPRIRYSDAVRDQAVRLVLESQKPITQVAKKFGCSVSTLQNWLKDHRQSTSGNRQSIKDHRQSASGNRQSIKDHRQSASGNRQSIKDHRQSASGNRQGVKAPRPGVKNSKQTDSQSKPADSKPGRHIVDDNHVPAATFIPVNLIDQKSATIEIVTPDGFTLKLTDTDPQYIAELLGVLGSC